MDSSDAFYAGDAATVALLQCALATSHAMLLLNFKLLL
jgi:hypothetical protein